MEVVTIPRIGAATAWRDAARGLLSGGVRPDQVTWGDTFTPKGLFDDQPIVRAAGAATVPRSFVAMANSVAWHSDPERFAWLYHFLWRLRDAPQLMMDRGDLDLARLRRMEKNVHRCQHKMKAFVRFREIGDPGANRRSFAAWFEPTYFTIEPTANFFRNRFGDMDWRIITPDVSVICESGDVRFVEGMVRPDLPDDASEALWITYFQNIFNPGRLKVKAMQSEMPKKYWKNLPEAAAIPDMIAGAPARARDMVAAAPTLPPLRTARVQAQLADVAQHWDGPKDALPAAIHACTRCPLYCNATQAVVGEGPLDARVMIVGEQPGDQEDLLGRPFVGPAGQVFDTAAQAVGLDRTAVYLTNAVKHFKFKPQGRRRIDVSPNRSEVEHCRWWLDAERALVKPDLIVAMGATAAATLTGNGAALSKRRGTVEKAQNGQRVLITWHPSYILRQPDDAARASAMAAFQDDLRLAVDAVRVQHV